MYILCTLSYTQTISHSNIVYICTCISCTYVHIIYTVYIRKAHVKFIESSFIKFQRILKIFVLERNTTHSNRPMTHLCDICCELSHLYLCQMDSVASEIEIRLVMFTEFKVQIPTQIQSKAKQSTIRRHSEVFSLTFVCWIDLVCVTKNDDPSQKKTCMHLEMVTDKLSEDMPITCVYVYVSLHSGTKVELSNTQPLWHHEHWCTFIPVPGNTCTRISCYKFQKPPNT
jgi:hypothetical protein